MKKHTSKKAVFLRSLLLLPLLALLLLGFSETRLVETEAISRDAALENHTYTNSECENVEHQTIQLFKHKILVDGIEFDTGITWLSHLQNKYAVDIESGRISKKHFNLVNHDNVEENIKELLYAFSGGVWEVHTGLTELDKYNVLAKKYNAIPIEKRKIPLADLKILESVFRKMTADQKKNTQPFPECLPQEQLMTQSEYLQSMIDNQATFYFNNTEISGVEAMQMIKNQTLNIFTPDNKKDNAKVYLTSDDVKEFTKNLKQSATRAQMKEYNTLAKKYNEMLSEKSNIHIKGQEVERMKYIYGLMSEKQKADSEPFPDFPPMPKAPKAPKPAKMVKAPEGEKSNIPSPREPQPAKPAKAPKVKKGEISDIPQPPTPPEPQTPLDHVIEMAKKGATFYYKGREVNSDEAIELLKNNKNLNIDSRGGNKKHPVVRISKNPIIIE